MTSSSNVQTCTKGYKEHRDSENKSLPKEHRKPPVTDPKKWKSKGQNNCSTDAQRTIREHR